MDDLRPGLQEAIRGERGVLARVVSGGTIRVGDTVAKPVPSAEIR
jgi:MOSC domain-containing protein YiiM